ncbi:MAG: beta-lactamase family protein, partial [Proteobacteria bacterium]|nr:beta-lactamase family protein [Pseudomonadota bacterium]
EALGAAPCAVQGEPPRPLEHVLEANDVDGFAVVHRGRLVYEHYRAGFSPAQTHILMSVSKSMVGSLIGILAGHGLVSLARTAGYYVPELRESGYGPVTVAALLDMRSRVRYSEDYDDPAAEFYDFDAACGLRPARHAGARPGMHAFLASLRADPDDRGDFRYRSTDSDVLGWIAERVGGRPLAQLWSELLWRPMGAEASAELLVDPLGAPLADGGLCATLRDLARFGLLQLEGGAVDGHTVIPAGWVAATRDGDRETFRRSPLAALFPNGAYSRQWWAIDPPAGVQLALGIHGQALYLDVRRRIVCAQFASQPQPVGTAALQTTLAACRAVVAALA